MMSYAHNVGAMQSIQRQQQYYVGVSSISHGVTHSPMVGGAHFMTPQFSNGPFSPSVSSGSLSPSIPMISTTMSTPTSYASSPYDNTPVFSQSGFANEGAGFEGALLEPALDDTSDEEDIFRALLDGLPFSMNSDDLMSLLNPMNMNSEPDLTLPCFDGSAPTPRNGQLSISHSASSPCVADYSQPQRSAPVATAPISKPQQAARVKTSPTLYSMSEQMRGMQLAPTSPPMSEVQAYSASIGRRASLPASFHATPKDSGSTPKRPRGSSTSGATVRCAPEPVHSGITCANCFCTQTSLWRRGSNGERLCNACGLYIRVYQKQRPVSMSNNVVTKRRRRRNTNDSP
eukprot:comp11397_c0_seq1/m.5773 comp11397_c0_seq1/g.5773  ORF comp11397_c0_seq1/g.5773 comp11397_c0_seq1/m.5773 type:complete len:345 (-) comp11397_c0_seq1:481-1515(-)